VQQVEVAVIGTGWCGGIRAETLSRSSIVDKLHICDIRPDRLAEVKAQTNAASATSDYRDILSDDRIKVVYISTTPESNHYPIARDCLKAGKHVLLEKPIALELFEADELIEIAKRGHLKFTIGYSQRFNPRLVYAKKKIADGTLGKPVSVMVSRHLSRGLGSRRWRRRTARGASASFRSCVAQVTAFQGTLQKKSPTGMLPGVLEIMIRPAGQPRRR
jgi:predicted dehydrogenase